MTSSYTSCRKALLSSLFLVAMIMGFSSPAWAGACSSNCLRVYSMDLTNLGTSIRGIVKLTDESGAGAGVRGSVVHARWTRPDGSELDQYANIGTRLRAQFSLYTAAAPGTYKLTVVDATKPGYKFDPKKSAILSQNISVGGTVNQPPIAVANADSLSGSAPLTVYFDSTGSQDPDGTLAGYTWEFGDGSVESGPNPVHVYENIGNFTATLTVTDDLGAEGSSSVMIAVSDGNAGCLSGCMTIDNISLRYRKNSGAITAAVWIEDENGKPVSNAAVRATWTLPDGTVSEDYGESGSRGKSQFILPASLPGVYTLTVVEVVRDGYSFDLENSNMLSGMISVSP